MTTTNRKRANTGKAAFLTGLVLAAAILALAAWVIYGGPRG